jgi:hypothetical protein
MREARHSIADAGPYRQGKPFANRLHATHAGLIADGGIAR